MIGMINLKNQCVNLYNGSLISNKIDMRGILSQVNEISNSRSGLTLFRGNNKLTIQHQSPPTESRMNRHGTFFQGLPCASQTRISKNDVSFKQINTSFKSEYYQLAFE